MQKVLRFACGLRLFLHIGAAALIFAAVPAWGEDGQREASEDATPLMTAARNGDLEGMRQALRDGADVNAADPAGITPLMKVMGNGYFSTSDPAEQVEAVRILLDAGADVNIVFKSHWDALNFGLDSKRLQPEVVRMLLDAGLKYDRRDMLTAAVQNNHRDVIRFLLKDADEAMLRWAGTALWQNEDLKPAPETMRCLIESGADISFLNATGRSALFTAICSRENADLALALIKYGHQRLNLEEQDAAGRTPLMWAMLHLETPVALALLEAGARADARDAQGRTPLTYAVGRSLWLNRNMANADKAEIAREVDRNLLRTLIAAGADPNAADANGMTVLMYALENLPDEGRLLPLLAAGARVSDRDAFGGDVWRRYGPLLNERVAATLRAAQEAEPQTLGAQPERIVVRVDWKSGAEDIRSSGAVGRTFSALYHTNYRRPLNHYCP